MVPSICGWVVLLFTCCFEIYTCHPFYKSHSLSSVSREKRGVAEYLTKLGQTAAEKLLKGTRRIELTRAKDNEMRVFLKTGSFDDAMNDFRSAGPSYVWEHTTKNGGKVWEGRVGDRHLFLRSQGKEATLDIIDYQKARVGYYGKAYTFPKVFGQPIDRIIYTTTN